MAASYRLANTETAIDARSDFFRVPVTNTTVELTSEQWFNPTGSLNGVFMFHVPNNVPSQYLDLRNSRLYISARLMRPNGTPLQDSEMDPTGGTTYQGDDVIPVNLLIHSMFKEIDVRLSQRPLQDCTGHYPYIAYLISLLEYSTEAKSDWMESMFYKKDNGIDRGNYSAVAKNESENYRFQWSRGNVFDMEGPLFCDIFRMPRLLPNGVPLTLKFTPAPDSFRLMTKLNRAYKIEIRQAILKIRCCTLSTPMVVGIENQWKETTYMKMPYWKTVVRSFIWDGKCTDNIYHNVFQGDIPNCLYIIITRNSTYAGAYDEDPWYFESFGLREISVYVNGALFNNNPLKINLEDRDDDYAYVEAFNQLSQNIKTWNKDAGTGIGRDEFLRGNMVFAFDFEPHLKKDLSVFAPVKSGNLSVRFTFPQGGPGRELTILFVGKFRNLFGISQGRQIEMVTQSNFATEKGRPTVS